MLELVETKQPLQAFRLWHSDWALTIAGVMIGYGHQIPYEIGNHYCIITLLSA